MSEDEVGAIFRRLQGSGIIAIAEQSDSRGVVPINDAAPEISQSEGKPLARVTPTRHDLAQQRKLTSPE